MWTMFYHYTCILLNCFWRYYKHSGNNEGPDHYWSTVPFILLKYVKSLLCRIDKFLKWTNYQNCNFQDYCYFIFCSNSYSKQNIKIVISKIIVTSYFVHRVILDIENNLQKLLECRILLLLFFFISTEIMHVANDFPFIHQ